MSDQAGATCIYEFGDTRYCYWRDVVVAELEKRMKELKDDLWWAVQNLEEPLYFPNEGDRQLWDERKRAIWDRFEP